MPAPIQSLNAPQSTQSEYRPARGADPPASVSSSGAHAGSGVPGKGNTAPPGSAQYKRSGGGIQVGEQTGFLRMRGLPFTASKEDIFKFFVVYNPILDTIVLTYRSDGRATGEAYVGFESPEDSTHAMDLHRKMMGNRYIELFLSNKEEHGRALTRFGNR
jgi:heterogeneous nuclear ribonucleoprotein F/H